MSEKAADSAPRGNLPKLSASIEQEKLNETHSGLMGMMRRRKAGQVSESKGEQRQAAQTTKRGMSLREFADQVRGEEVEEVEESKPAPTPPRRPDTQSRPPASGASLAARILGGKR